MSLETMPPETLASRRLSRSCTCLALMAALGILSGCSSGSSPGVAADSTAPDTPPVAMSPMAMEPTAMEPTAMEPTAMEETSNPQPGTAPVTDSMPDASPPEPGSARQGRFLDAAVEGLAWSTPSASGLTDSEGRFDYLVGESVTFSIGDVALPAVTATDTMTALDLFDTSDTNAVPVVNLNRLLQTLDSDGNADNGIRIDPAANLAATGLVVDFEAGSFDRRVVNWVANAGSPTTTLISRQRATTHFLDTLTREALPVSGCTATHPLVGRSTPLVGVAHAVAGMITVLDDCTLEVRDFEYDGGGPDVGFYAGSGANYGANPVRLTPALDGLEFAGDTLRLTLPEGTTLDDIDRLSVWCFDFSVTFGDALLPSI